MVKADKQTEQNQQEAEKQPHKRRFTGVVVSTRMNKTLLVRVDRVKQHPKYKKRYTVSKKFPVHDEKQQFRRGDEVQFVECRPLSKRKRWRVLYD